MHNNLKHSFELNLTVLCDIPLNMSREYRDKKKLCY